MKMCCRGLRSIALLVFVLAYSVSDLSADSDLNPTVATWMAEGDSAFQARALQAAIDAYTKAEAAMRDELPPNAPEWAKLYQNRGSAYASLGTRFPAIEDLERAREGYEHLEGNHLNALAKVYMDLSHLYLETWNFDKAVTYGQQATVIHEEAYGKIHPLVAKAYGSLGHVYTVMEKNTPALKYHLKAFEIESAYFGDKDPNQYRRLNSLGNVYHNLKDSARAVEYYMRARAVAAAKWGEHSDAVGGVDYNLGIHYFDYRNYELSREYWRKAVPRWGAALGYDHFEVTNTQIFIGETFHEQGRYDSAIACFDFVLEKMTPGYAKRGSHALPELNISPDIDIMYLVIAEKGASLLGAYKYGGKDARDIEAAVRYLDLSMSLLDSIRLGVYGEEARLHWADYSYQYIEAAIEAVNLNYQRTRDRRWLEKAFEYMERSKSTVLMSALNTARAAGFAGIPQELIEQERKMRRKLAVLNKEIYEIQHSDGEIDQARLVELENEAFQLQVALDALIHDIEMRHPEFYRLKYNLQVIGLAETQQLLPKDGTTLIEYFSGDSAIYVCAINHDAVLLERVPVTDIDNRIRKFLDYFDASSVYRRSDRFEYPAEAYALYAAILKPVEQMFAEDGQLIIVPDGKLGHLPFEALIWREPTESERGNFAAFPYLLHRYAVSYANSATLIQYNEESPEKGTDLRLMAFAPGFDNGEFGAQFSSGGLRAGLSELKFAPREVERISRYVEGDVYTGEAASEGVFKDNGKQYGILHFATHGIVEDENPLYSRIAFSSPKDSTVSGEDGMLHTYELFNMNLNAELAVLSACNTGKGKVHRGEGIMSLARGFMYAGCPSIVVSLWAVNDESASEIMEHFYRHLSDGQTKDVALQKARQDYLSTASGRAAHPYYWAAHVLIGDRDSFIEKSGGGIWLWLILAFVAGLVYYEMRGIR